MKASTMVITDLILLDRPVQAGGAFDGTFLSRIGIFLDMKPPNDHPAGIAPEGETGGTELHQVAERRINHVYGTRTVVQKPFPGGYGGSCGYPLEAAPVQKEVFWVSTTGAIGQARTRCRDRRELDSGKVIHAVLAEVSQDGRTVKIDSRLTDENVALLRDD